MKIDALTLHLIILDVQLIMRCGIDFVMHVGFEIEAIEPSDCKLPDSHVFVCFHLG